jgi:SAM-dependent methyltransferase
VLGGQPSLLDIGCGIGQYSRITEGEYLGVDLNARYVEHARNRRRGENREFRCADVTTLHTEGLAFDVVLMVDVLHHLSDDQCVELLGAAGRLARRHVVSFEPITEQTHPVGRWIVDNDRGDHVRPLRGLHALFEASRLPMERSVALRLGPIDTRAVLCGPAAGQG